jgi:predicted DNA-binding protein (UPF0251 family)
MQYFCNNFAKFANKSRNIYANSSKNSQKKMDELENIRQRRATEHRQGDVRKACERVGVSATIFQSALRKTQINDLTDKELKVLLAFRDVLDERASERDMLRKLI